MNTPSKWCIVQSSKEEHLTVWKVQRKVDGRKETAFFKFPHRGSYKYIGPLLANELVCNKLAQIIGLPVAKTVVARVRGKTGILSFAKRKSQLRTWNRVMKGHSNPFCRIANPKLLYRTFVFDVWIQNIDRSGKNIVMYPKSNKYDFYLIDHELALLGAIRYEDKPWDSAFWDNVIQFTDGYHPALLKYINNDTKLEPHVRTIQRIPPKTIERIINRISSQLLSTSDKILMKKILLHRQQRLADIMSQCVMTGSTPEHTGLNPSPTVQLPVSRPDCPVEIDHGTPPEMTTPIENDKVVGEGNPKQEKGFTNQAET